MRRAVEKLVASRPTTSITQPAIAGPRLAIVADLEEEQSQGEPITDSQSDDRTIRREQLRATIRKRIESRLAGRVRNLAVRVLGDTVVLEGQCATFYTKQLAQHAALGILEDEHLDNAIVVDGPQ
jgi:hypothetical protein